MADRLEQEYKDLKAEQKVLAKEIKRARKLDKIFDDGLEIGEELMRFKEGLIEAGLSEEEASKIMLLEYEFTEG